MGDDYVWIGASGGAWGDAANWRDVTTAAAGVAAPGSLDSASIVGTSAMSFVVAGGGAAAALTAAGVMLQGAFALGHLSASNVDLASGSVLQADSST